MFNFTTTINKLPVDVGYIVDSPKIEICYVAVPFESAPEDILPYLHEYQMDELERQCQIDYMERTIAKNEYEKSM